MERKSNDVADFASEQAAIDSCSSTRLPAGLISNPLSFYNRRRPELVLQNILNDYPEVHKYPTQNREDIRDAVAALRAIDARLIIANGGDGTVQGVITEVWNQWQGENMPLLAVMPGGRTNVISRDLNAKMRPRNILRNILKNYCSGDESKHTYRSPLNIQINGQPTELGFLISAAGLAGGIEQCWAFRNRYRKKGLFGGLGTAVWVINRLLGTPAGNPILDPRAARVTIDGEGIPGDSQQLIMVTTNHQLPVKVNPFWQQRDDEKGSIKVTVMRSDTQGLWWRTLPLAKGWGRFLPEEAGFYSRKASSIQLLLEDSFHLDGEDWALEYPQVVNINPGPKLKFLVA